MCKSCGCETSGKNPRQLWREMSDNCEHMVHMGHEAGTEIRMCWNGVPRDTTVSGLLPKPCVIDECPRLKVETPKDNRFYSEGRGLYTVFYSDIKSAAIQKVDSYIEEKKEMGHNLAVVCQGWMTYKGYVVYFIQLRNVKEPRRENKES